MHPTTSELLERRDDDDSLAVRNGLRALPELAPPPGAWDRIVAEHRRRQRSRTAWRAVAAAAVIAVAALSATLGQLSSPTPRSRQAMSPTADLRDLVAASHDLERVLRTPALQSPVLRPVQAARIVALEDRIAAIDVELGTLGSRVEGDRAVVLWSDRVELLDELVRARAGTKELQDVRPASFEAEGREP